MGRWAQRRRGGTDRHGPVAQITRVSPDGADPTIARVTFSQNVTATAGAGQIDLTTSGGSSIFNQGNLDARTVLYGNAADPIAIGDGWTLVNQLGLAFAAGTTLVPPFAGTVT
jgi:hypothetical protein